MLQDHQTTATRSHTVFDRALELHDLDEAVDAYASRHGVPGSFSYRTAWLRFRSQIRTAEDLRRGRTSVSVRRPMNGEVLSPRAGRPSPRG
jgi:hypothetical protein